MKYKECDYPLIVYFFEYLSIMLFALPVMVAYKADIFVSTYLRLSVLVLLDILPSFDILFLGIFVVSLVCLIVSSFVAHLIMCPFISCI